MIGCSGKFPHVRHLPHEAARGFGHVDQFETRTGDGSCIGEWPNAGEFRLTFDARNRLRRREHRRVRKSSLPFGNAHVVKRVRCNERANRAVCA